MTSFKSWFSPGHAPALSTKPSLELASDRAVGEGNDTHRVAAATKNGHVKVSLVHNPPSKAYTKWTPVEEQRLLDLFSGGHTIAAIAEELGRRPGGIRRRLQKLGELR